MNPSFTLHDGLAVYRRGEGAPLLLLPYPHSSTFYPMAEDKLAEMLANLGWQVISFDPPGAYRSTRSMQGNMTEMLECTLESLKVYQVNPPIPVVGHSMGALCALGLAIQHPDQVQRLVLIGGCSGFPAVLRYSVPHNWNPWRNPEWWQCFWLGFRQMLGLGNLAVHKQLDNLVEVASFVDQRHVELWSIERDDHKRPPPPRSKWLRTARRVDYRNRLNEIYAPTWIAVGRHDPQTPLACSEELTAGISHSTLVVFEDSGHSPFLEEPELFSSKLAEFLQPQ